MDSKEKNKTVLLVDDDHMILEVGKAMMERLGYRVLTAENGPKSLAVFQENMQEISCILLDLTMPGMDGVETFQELRKLHADTPVIIVSGFSDSEIINQLGEKRPSGFIQKPFTLDGLSEKLEEIL